MKPTIVWRAAARAARFLFPSRCVGCDSYLRDDGLACRWCRPTLFDIDGPICRICGLPRPTVAGGYGGVDEICARCLERRPRFQQARARWAYEGLAAEAVQRAKYGAQLWVARSLAGELRPWLTAQLQALGANRDRAPLVTVVPMHPRDLRRRGFNLAHLIARHGFVEHRVRTLLTKTRRTPSQAGLARADRLTNVRGAFECPRPERVAGHPVVLFDDVMTTGATVDEAARTLRRAGATDVFVLTAARAVRA